MDAGTAAGAADVGARRAPTYSQFACVGAGFSGIGLGATLQRWYGITDLRIFERSESLGGTWWSAQYPGAACDVPTALYSLSYAPNPAWTRLLPSQPELWAYLRAVAERYDLVDRMTFGVEVERCEWQEARGRWLLSYRDVRSGVVSQHESRFLFAATGQLVTPRQLDVPGAETFAGPIFHSARWRHDVDLTGKRVIVIGNGCTGNQIVPSIAPTVKHLTHLVRSKHWVLPPIDRENAAALFPLLRMFPWVMRAMRLLIFLITENAFRGFYLTPAAQRFRDKQRRVAEKYMREAAPAEYHDRLIPEFEVGCKRRIFDTGYLPCLHRSNVDLVMDQAIEVVPEGIRTKENGLIEADVIVLANGYQPNPFFGNMTIVGRDGETTQDHWKRFGGPEAYNCAALSGFPNFFSMLGPNTATGHTSALLASENSINYAMRIIKPILDGKAAVCSVRPEAEANYVRDLHAGLGDRVWETGCSSWYLNRVDGKSWNAMTYPFTQFHFWYRSAFPVWQDWEFTGKAKATYTRSSSSLLKTLFFTLSIVGFGLAWKLGGIRDLQSLRAFFASSLTSIKSFAQQQVASLKA